MVPSLRKIVGAAVAILLLPFPQSSDAEAQNPYRTGTHLQRVRQFYTGAEGLPADQIRSLAVTREGLVIVAASNSVSRLEGDRWNAVNGPAGVTSLFAPTTGPLALAGATNGTWAFTDGKWSLEPQSPERVMCF